MVVVYRDGAWYPEMPPSPPETVATLPGHRRCHPETLPSRDHLGTVVSRDGLLSSWDGMPLSRDGPDLSRDVALPPSSREGGFSGGRSTVSR